MLIVGRTDAKAESLTLRELILRRVDKESRASRRRKGQTFFFSVFLHLSHTKALCAM